MKPLAINNEDVVFLKKDLSAIRAKLEKKLKAAQEKFNKHEREDEKIQEEIDRLYDKIADLEDKQYSRHCSEIEDEIYNLEEDMESCKQLYESLNGDYQNIAYGDPIEDLLSNKSVNILEKIQKIAEEQRDEARRRNMPHQPCCCIKCKPITKKRGE